MTTDQFDGRIPFFVAEVIFLSIFLTEMGAKLHLDGWNYFLDPWNIMDYHLVVLGFVDVLLEPEAGWILRLAPEIAVS